MSRITLVLFALAGLTAASSTQFTAQAVERKEDSKLTKLLAFEPQKPEASDSEMRKLLKERYAAAWNEMNEEIKAKAQFVENVDATPHYDMAHRVLDSFLALDPKPADRIQMLGNLVEYAREREMIMNKFLDAAAVRQSDIYRARYFRIDAEIALVKAKEAK